MSHAIPWSYSKLKLYEGCALRYKFKYMDKLPDSPPGPAAARGIEKHNEIEQYIKGYGSHETPPGPESIWGALDKMRANNSGWRAAEFKVGFDDEWHPVGWQLDNTWGRGVLDAVWHDKATDVVEVYEWKTGKPREEHKEQRELYALFSLQWWGTAEVNVTTIYLDETGPNKRRTMRDNEVEPIKRAWRQRVIRMEKEERFAPSPDWTCRWCAYSRDQGGPCPVA